MIHNAWNQRSTFLYGFAIFLIFVAFLLLAQAHISKNPLRGDEVDYYRSMENVFTLGLPLYYAGEVNLQTEALLHLSTRRLAGAQFEFYRFRPETGVLKETFFAIKDGTSRYTYGMWHPPLYIYLGALWFRLVPLTPITSSGLRYFNLIFSIGIFIGMIALSHVLYGGGLGLTAALATLLYTTCSLAVRGSILIDYNATLAPCVAIWLVFVYLRCERGHRNCVALGLLTVLAFLTSLGIGAALLAGIYAYVALSGQIRRSRRALTAVGAGFTAFFPIFLALARLLNLPFSQPFLHNIQRVGIQSDLAWLIAQIQAAAELNVFYSREVGYPLILAAIILTAWRYVTGQASQAPARLLLPTLIIAGFALYSGLRADAWGFPKYILYLLPILCTYLAGETTTHLSAGDMRLWRRWLIRGALTIVVLLQLYSTLAGLIQPGSTLYFPGEQGIEFISQQVQATTAADETILGMKDVAFFADRKFVQWRSPLLSNASALHEWVATRQICVLVSNVSLLHTISPDVADYLARAFPLSVQSGDFQMRYTLGVP